MTDPAIEAARTFVDHSLDAMRRAIVGSAPELLNWRPAGDETNSIAIIAVHAVTSTRWWLNVAITGNAPERDRAAEFRTKISSTAQLLSIVDAVSADCRELLKSDEPLDLAVSRTDPREGGSTTTVAWALIHAIEHLQEHVAHAELTRQMWELTGGA